jgi:Carboxypeptidase regulatory-like domain/Tetratricopeptide repeat
VLRDWIALCGLAALLSMPAAGFLPAVANPNANLAGIVYSESTNQRIRHASVWLCDSGGNRLQDSVTSDSGEFSFLSVHAGAFILKVSAPGYQTAEIPVEVNFGSERGISVFLKAAKTSAAGVPPATISAHEAGMPQSARDLVDSGKRKLYADKNPPKALSDFESAVAKAPGYYEAYYLIGMTYLTLGDPARAETNLQKSVDLSSQTYPDAVLALAILWLGRHDATRGEPLLRHGLELNPNSWVGFFELGKLEMYREHFDAALAAAQNAKFLAPEQPLVYRLLSLIHLKQKNYAAALADLDAYIRLDPDSPDGLHAKQVRADTEKRLANTHPPAAAAPNSP